MRLTPAARWLERICRQRPIVSVLAASLLGVASPLCTYGTVPLVLELVRGGTAVAPLATFLATSSLMNPQLFIMTWGGLGPTLTFIRLFAILVLGLLVGGALQVVPRRWTVQPVLDRRGDEEHPTKRVPTLGRYLARSWHTFEFVGFYVLIGVLAGAIVEVVIPGRWIFSLFGAGGWWQLLLASLLGVPLHACGGGTIPLVQSLLEQGMSPGAAVAFLIAGPATRVAPLMALATILRPRLVATYVVVLIVYATLAGAMAGLVLPPR
jgi:hypothetical protein